MKEGGCTGHVEILFTGCDVWCGGGVVWYGVLWCGVEWWGGVELSGVEWSDVVVVLMCDHIR